MKAISWNSSTAKLSRPCRRGQQLPLAEHRQHDGGGGQGESSPEHRRPGPGQSRHMGEHGDDGGSRHQLPEAEAEHRLAQDPQPVRPQFEPDQEEQHNNAEFGDMGDLLDIRDQSQPRRGRSRRQRPDSRGCCRSPAGAIAEQRLQWHRAVQPVSPARELPSVRVKVRLCQEPKPRSPRHARRRQSTHVFLSGT